MLYLNSLVGFCLCAKKKSVVNQIVQVIASSEFFSDLLLWSHPHMVHAKDMWIARSFYLEILYKVHNYVYDFNLATKVGQFHVPGRV